MVRVRLLDWRDGTGDARRLVRAAWLRGVEVEVERKRQLFVDSVRQALAGAKHVHTGARLPHSTGNASSPPVCLSRMPVYYPNVFHAAMMRTNPHYT
jgi:hypothetical protein